MVGACGNNCSDCFHYGASCDGCLNEMTLSYAYMCEVYQCVLQKRVKRCTECSEFKSCAKNSESRMLCPLLIEKFTRSNSCRVDIPDSAH